MPCATEGAFQEPSVAKNGARIAKHHSVSEPANTTSSRLTFTGRAENTGQLGLGAYASRVCCSVPRRTGFRRDAEKGTRGRVRSPSLFGSILSVKMVSTSSSRRVGECACSLRKRTASVGPTVNHGANQVGLSGKIFPMQPETIAEPVNKPAHRQLRLHIFAADRPHVRAAVHHGFFSEARIAFSSTCGRRKITGRCERKRNLIDSRGELSDAHKVSLISGIGWGSNKTGAFGCDLLKIGD